MCESQPKTQQHRVPQQNGPELLQGGRLRVERKDTLALRGERRNHRPVEERDFLSVKIPKFQI